MENKVVIYKTSSGFATFVFGNGKCLDLNFTTMELAMAVSNDYAKQLGLTSFVVHHMDKRLVYNVGET